MIIFKSQIGGQIVTDILQRDLSYEWSAVDYPYKPYQAINNLNFETEIRNRFNKSNIRYDIWNVDMYEKAQIYYCKKS